MDTNGDIINMEKTYIERGYTRRRYIHGEGTHKERNTYGEGIYYKVEKYLQVGIQTGKDSINSK